MERKPHLPLPRRYQALQKTLTKIRSVVGITVLHHARSALREMGHPGVMESVHGIERFKCLQCKSGDGAQVKKAVNCGGSSAPTCAACVQGQGGGSGGESQCNGNCFWWPTENGGACLPFERRQSGSEPMSSSLGASKKLA